MASEWDRGMLAKSSWHGLEEVGAMADALAMIAAGEGTGAWPTALGKRQVRQASLVALARLEVRLGLAEPAEETNMSGEVPAN